MCRSSSRSPDCSLRHDFEDLHTLEIGTPGVGKEASRIRQRSASPLSPRRLVESPCERPSTTCSGEQGRRTGVRRRPGPQGARTAVVSLVELAGPADARLPCTIAGPHRERARPAA